MAVRGKPVPATQSHPRYAINGWANYRPVDRNGLPVTAIAPETGGWQPLTNLPVVTYRNQWKWTMGSRLALTTSQPAAHDCLDRDLPTEPCDGTQFSERTESPKRWTPPSIDTAPLGLPSKSCGKIDFHPPSPASLHSRTHTPIAEPSKPRTTNPPEQRWAAAT